MRQPEIDWPSDAKTDEIINETGLTQSQLEDKIVSGIRRGEHLADVALKYVEPFVTGDEDVWENRWNDDEVLMMWFGRIDKPNHATDVYRRLETAYDRLSSEVLTVNVKEDLPNDYHAQNLGGPLSPNAFRVAPEWFAFDDTGRGAILIHELLHQWFPDQELQSGEKVYGSSKAKQLAVEDPDHARRSPENYEWLCRHLDTSGGSDDWDPAGGYFPAGAEVRAVSRRPDQMDAFVIGNNGVVFTSSWTKAQGWSGAADDWWPIGGDFAPGAPLAAVARTPDNIDVFHRAKNGVVYSSAWSPGNGWSGADGEWWQIGDAIPTMVPTKPFPFRTPTVSAVSRGPDRLDLVTTGGNGFVYTCGWSSTNGWSTWSSIGGTFAPNAPLSLVARTPDKLDVFVTGETGIVHTSAWSPAKGWSGTDDDWWPIGRYFPPSAPLGVVARTPDNLDVFVIGSDGIVYTSAWSPANGWSGIEDWWPIGGYFRPGAPVTAIAPSADRIEAYATGMDGIINQSVWSPSTGWQHWSPLGEIGPAGVPDGAPLDVVDHGNVALLLTGANGVVYTLLDP